MDQPSAVVVIAFAVVWPRAMEMEIGTTLCAISVGRTLTLLILYYKIPCQLISSMRASTGRYSTVTFIKTNTVGASPNLQFPCPSFFAFAL